MKEYRQAEDVSMLRMIAEVPFFVIKGVVKILLYTAVFLLLLAVAVVATAITLGVYVAELLNEKRTRRKRVK